MSDRAKAAADRIRELVPILEVLVTYNYRVRADGGEREQQFQCDLHGTGKDNKPSARVYPESNSWYCVSIADRVLTSEGWSPLGGVASSGPPVLNGSGVFRQPLAYTDKGQQPCVTLRTSAGYQVTLTLDHEVEIQGRGWVPAGQVRIGDVPTIPRPLEMSFNTGLQLPCAVADLNALKFRGHPSLNLPSIWSLELGEALGYVFGDGWVTPRPGGSSGVVGITSSAEDATDARKVFRHLQVWANGRGGECHKTGIATTPNGNKYTEDQYIFSIGNDGFCEWFQRLGLAKDEAPHQRRLPATLWTAPRVAVQGFLRGIYATDGSVFRPKGRKGIKVNLYSVSEGFLQDVQLLLLQFGIYSRLNPPATTRPGGVWYLQLATGRDILCFRDVVGVANERKSAVLRSFEYNTRGSRAFKPRVVSIVPAGVLPVADLSMPTEHSFVAGGIKVHNCFACDATRDPIGTVMAKEGVKFWEAIRLLEQAYGLDSLPADYGTGEDTRPGAISLVAAELDPAKTFSQDVEMVRRYLDNRTTDKDLPLSQILRFWEKLDEVMFHVQGPKEAGGSIWPEDRGRVMLRGLLSKMQEVVQVHRDAQA